MSTKHKLFVPIAIVVGTMGIGSIAIAGLNMHRNSNLPIAQKHDGMNHSGMSHNMDVGPADANYDLRFVDSMIPHHQGALVMAQEVIQKSKRPELVKFAKAIISEQQKEIAQMQQWRKQWYPKASATPMMWHSEMNHQMAMTAEYKQSMMMSMSLGAADAGFDLRFLNAMIPHHQGAVTMAKDSLKKSTRPQLQKLARSILVSQQSEIDRMTQWRQKWYGGK
ncbi:DUF305 domain-containing protein [Chamaesiphon sp. VAR_48_metabat_403]|uniref:DUF305 domain-containing protein n=1 Tax=Chamaesiphon sp. VAR_48_metabat_403 TaxID=2964700 RepID=UPI00286D869E|nr:DUF305 domain-containing protein [Chamaesiphon sp. VAR_48_metabat_403]